MYLRTKQKQMDWEQLLSLKRYGDTRIRLRSDQDETRLGFDVDYDRIIFSSAFRGLQDKTQVMPLPVAMANNRNFIHTRLTHSLEVSVVARSLGRKVGQQIIARHPFLKKKGFQFNDFGAITATAALAHDIGNPPFGHSGEKAIGTYFSHGHGKKFKSSLTRKEYQDLVDFEGNANGFKLLVTDKQGTPGGLRLSYATLGAFLKYPKESLPKRPSPAVSDKKFGFFQAEKTSFVDLVKNLGLLAKENENVRFHRHPLAYLVEAADDICYTIIDFEDGINLGLISYDYALEYLINLVKDSVDSKKYHGIKNRREQLAYLRALSIGTLVEDASQVFLDNEQKIMQGAFEFSLLQKSRFEAQVTDIIKLCVEKVYRSDQVVEKELAGYQILTNLLETVCSAMINHKNGMANEYDSLMLQKIGEGQHLADLTDYEILLKASSLVAGLSDGAAVRLNTIITGNHL